MSTDLLPWLLPLAASSTVSSSPRGLLLAVALLTTTSHSCAETPGALLERAREAYHQDRLREALEAVRLAVSLAPDWNEAVLSHASLAEFMGEFDEAAQAYERAVQLAPHDPAVRYGVAGLAIRLGDYDRALRELDAVLAGQSLTVQFLYRYGPTRIQPYLFSVWPELRLIAELRVDVLMETGDLDAARRAAWGYALIESGRDYCMERKASGYRIWGDEELRLLRLATLAQPTARECIWWYGQLLADTGYMRLGRLIATEALRHGSSEAQKEPGYRYVKSRLGGGHEIPKRAESLFLAARQRYLRNRDAEGAIRLLDAALTIAPQFDRPYIMKARIANEAGDRAASVHWLLRALEVDHYSWRAHHNLGRVLAELQRWTDAERVLSQALVLLPEDTSSRLLLARVLYARRDFNRYAAETEKVLQLATGPDRDAITDVAAFYEAFRHTGPRDALPPTPNYQLFPGLGQD